MAKNDQDTKNSTPPGKFGADAPDADVKKAQENEAQAKAAEQSAKEALERVEQNGNGTVDPQTGELQTAPLDGQLIAGHLKTVGEAAKSLTQLSSQLPQSMEGSVRADILRPDTSAPFRAGNPKRFVGDVPVTCIKTESSVSLGTRHYSFVKGAEIEMDPSHAKEMQDSGWVVIINPDD